MEAFVGWGFAEILLAFIAIGAAVVAFGRIRDRLAEAPLIRQKIQSELSGLKSLNIDKRLSKLEQQDNLHEERDRANTAMLDKIYNSVGDIRSDVEGVRVDQAKQHEEIGNTLQAEVRRLEEKLSEARCELFERIDEMKKL